MDIRLATEIELPILESLAREIWPHTYSDIITKEQMDFMLNWMYSKETLIKQRKAGHEFYILQKDSTDIGFLAIEQAGDELKVNKVYVLPTSQGLGAGKKLMDKIAKMRSMFVDGCVRTSDMSETLANKIFSDIEYFGGYGFAYHHDQRPWRVGLGCGRD